MSLNRCRVHASSFLAFLVLLCFACEEDDPELTISPASPQISAQDGYFVARAGEDRSISTGDTVMLKAIFANNQRNNSFSWEFISKPDNSSAELISSNGMNTSFRADVPGIYTLQLGMFFEEFSSFDTVKVSAFTISNLQGTYTTPENGADGIVRQFLVYKDQLYAVGDFINIGGVASYGIARFDGNDWIGFGEELQVDQLYQMIVYKDQLYVSGSSREVAKDGRIKYALWDSKKWTTLGFADEGHHMEVLQDNLYMNFGNQLGKWDGSELTFIEVPEVDRITYMETANGMLFLRGFSDENCVNSTENVWVSNCEASGYLMQYDGNRWSDFNSDNISECMNIGLITWDEHVWYNTTPDFKWDILQAYEGRLYFACGFTDNGMFNEFSYPFEKIYSIQVLYGDELYLSGQNQKTGDYSGIMKWDGDQWFTLGAGVDGVITTIQSFQGKLYIGGRFNRAIGQPKTNFTIWQGN